jgi:transcriptional regulator with XRE-family HTH domain
MNIGKSIKVALAMKGMTQKELAKRLDITPPALSQLAGQESCTGATIGRLATALQMKASEFVALGEE